MTLPRLRYVGAVLLLAGVYGVVAHLALMMDAVAGFASLVWPPTGIALVALLLLGLRYWPAVALGAFAANLWTGAPAPAAVGIAIGNCLEAVLAAYALRRVHFHEGLARLRDVLALVVLAGLLSTLVSASIGVASLWGGNVITAAQIGETWRAWWLGDLIGDLLVAPVLLTVIAGWGLRGETERSRVRLLEEASLVVATALVAGVLFGPFLVGFRSTIYLFPPLTWAALRFGPRGASLTTLMVAGIAIWGTALAHGPFVRGSLAASLLPLQSFIAVVAITALALAATIAERDEAVGERRKSETRSRFLADASKRLQESLNDELTLQRLAGFAVPAIADCCSVIAIDERGHAHRVATIHRDPEKQRLAEEYGRRFSAAHQGETDHQRLLQSERSAWLADAPELGVTSCVVAVLPSRTASLGIIALLRTGRTPGFDEADQALADELGRRTAMAVENARLYQEAQGAVLSREEVLAVVSHDLNNILSAMMGSTQLMLKVAEEQQRESDKKGLRIIQRSVQRMARLIGDLLDAASLDAGALSLETASHDADELLREVVEMETSSAEQKGLRLDSVGLDAPLQVVCDRSRIVQVLANLISNSLKFTELGGIHLGLRREGHELVFEVSDTGRGIPQEQLDHIYDRYWTAGSSEVTGHGLGLHIAKGIIEAHGGRIWAENRTEGGCAFFFTLPVAA